MKTEEAGPIGEDVSREKLPLEDLVSHLASEVSQQTSPVTLDLNREARSSDLFLRQNMLF